MKFPWNFVSSCCYCSCVLNRPLLGRRLPSIHEACGGSAASCGGFPFLAISLISYWPVSLPFSLFLYAVFLCFLLRALPRLLCSSRPSPSLTSFISPAITLPLHVPPSICTYIHPSPSLIPSIPSSLHLPPSISRSFSHLISPPTPLSLRLPPSVSLPLTSSPLSLHLCSPPTLPASLHLPPSATPPPLSPVSCLHCSPACHPLLLSPPSPPPFNLSHTLPFGWRTPDGTVLSGPARHATAGPKVPLTAL